MLPSFTCAGPACPTSVWQSSLEVESFMRVESKWAVYMNMLYFYVIDTCCLIFHDMMTMNSWWCIWSPPQQKYVAWSFFLILPCCAETILRWMSFWCRAWIVVEHGQLSCWGTCIYSRGPKWVQEVRNKSDGQPLYIIHCIQHRWFHEFFQWLSF